jgi:hypothetical protein
MLLKEETKTTEGQLKETKDENMQKEHLEQVPTTHAGDRILRRRRKSRSFFPSLFRNIRKLVRDTRGR